MRLHVGMCQESDSGSFFHPHPPSLLILLSELGSERKVLSEETWFSLVREWKSWKLQWKQLQPRSGSRQNKNFLPRPGRRQKILTKEIWGWGWGSNFDPQCFEFICTSYGRSWCALHAPSWHCLSSQYTMCFMTIACGLCIDVGCLLKLPGRLAQWGANPPTPYSIIQKHPKPIICSKFAPSPLVALPWRP